MDTSQNRNHPVEPEFGRGIRDAFLRGAGSVAGGAMLGAALGGPFGAIVGGSVGFLLGQQANKAKEQEEGKHN